jgi:hypothetical protein
MGKPLHIGPGKTYGIDLTVDSVRNSRLTAAIQSV